MTDTTTTSRPPSFGLGLLFGFVVGLATGLFMDPSCNGPEMESQPLGKPAPTIAAEPVTDLPPVS